MVSDTKYLSANDFYNPNQYLSKSARRNGKADGQLKLKFLEREKISKYMVFESEAFANCELLVEPLKETEFRDRNDVFFPKLFELEKECFRRKRF